uniref:Candidate secreted effector n=1 Tax=Meloidogyne incognita TaxID=6306 RepID=A0A914KWX9_MELIC
MGLLLECLPHNLSTNRHLFNRLWLVDSGPLPTPTHSIVDQPNPPLGTGYPLSDPSPQPTQYL